MNKLTLARDQIARMLKLRLEEISKMCRAPDDPLALDGLTVWPSAVDLGELQGYIRRLASLYGQRGGSTTWSCILVIENKRRRLRLRKHVQDLIDRVDKVYWPQPRALTEIGEQAKEGSAAAKACFDDLKQCAHGQSEVAAVNWEQYRKILEPAEGETCKEKAAQLCLDGLRW